MLSFVFMPVLSRLLHSFKFFAVVVVVVAMVMMVMRPLQFHVVVVPEREPGPTVAETAPPRRDLARSAVKHLIESQVVAEDHVVAVRNDVAVAFSSVEAWAPRPDLAAAMAATVSVTER